MATMEFFPMLQELDRLEAVLMEGAEIPLSGRRLVRKKEVLELVHSIRRALPIAAESYQEDSFSDEPALRQAREEGMQDSTVSSEYVPKGFTDSNRSHIGNPAKGFRSHSRIRRKRAVKVFLSDDELSLLDKVCGESGLDRESVFRHLLLVHQITGIDRGHFSASKESGGNISRINIADMGAKPAKPTIELMEPRSFDEVPLAIQALRERKSVILNLTMMEPDQAQRAVDFAAGGTFYGDGCQERVGESIFLFCPDNFDVKTPTSADAADNGYLIGIESNTSSASHVQPLTELQEASLRLIRERWKSNQQNTEPHDLVAALSPSTDANASFRLFRRVLFALSRKGLIKKINEDEDCLIFMPADEHDHAGFEAHIEKNGYKSFENDVASTQIDSLPS